MTKMLILHKTAKQEQVPRILGQSLHFSFAYLCTGIQTYGTPGSPSFPASYCWNSLALANMRSIFSGAEPEVPRVVSCRPWCIMLMHSHIKSLIAERGLSNCYNITTETERGKEQSACSDGQQRLYRWKWRYEFTVIYKHTYVYSSASRLLECGFERRMLCRVILDKSI